MKKMIVKTTFDNEKDNTNSSKAVTNYLNNKIGIRRPLSNNIRTTAVESIYADRIAMVPVVRGRNEFVKIIMCSDNDNTTTDWLQTMFFYMKFKENADELEWIYYSRSYRSTPHLVHCYSRIFDKNVWLMVKHDGPLSLPSHKKTFLGDYVTQLFNTHVFTTIPEL
jgi:hypothetical protein